MKRIVSIVTVVFLLGVVGYSALAEEGEGGGAMGPGQEKGDVHPGKGMGHGAMKGMCRAHGMAMKMMAGRELAATSDGGVVILAGNKLYKYNKDLKLVNEAEVSVDAEGMEKMMAEMKEKCPQCKAIMEHCSKMGPPPEEAAPAKTPETQEEK